MLRNRVVVLVGVLHGRNAFGDVSVSTVGVMNVGHAATVQDQDGIVAGCVDATSSTRHARASFVNVDANTAWRWVARFGKDVMAETRRECLPMASVVVVVVLARGGMVRLEESLRRAFRGAMGESIGCNAGQEFPCSNTASTGAAGCTEANVQEVKLGDSIGATGIQTSWTGGGVVLVVLPTCEPWTCSERVASVQRDEVAITASVARGLQRFWCGP